MKLRSNPRPFLWFCPVLSIGLWLLLSSACSHSVAVGTDNPSQSSDLRPVELTHERCDVEAKDAIRTDVDNNKHAEVIRVMSGGREVCRAVDLNFDGQVDSYVYLDGSGQVRRAENDFDRDGVTDEIAMFENGKLVRKFRETNLDHKLDTWDFYSNEVLVRRERDTNGDGRVDQWWSFPDPTKLDCPIVEADGDGDGRPDSKQDICKEREAAQQALSAAALPVPAAPASALSPTPAPQDAGTKDSGGGR